MKQLTLDLGLPPQSAIPPPVPLTAALKRELVTQMATAIITVYQAGVVLENNNGSFTLLSAEGLPLFLSLL